MKIKSLVKSKMIILLLCYVLTSVLSIGFATKTNASTPPLDASELTENVINSSNCPESIKNYARKLANQGGAINNADGTFIVARRGNENLVMTCPGATDIEKLGIRLIVILQSLLGLVLAFSLGKNAVAMATAASSGNEEKYQASLKGVVNSIVYSVGALAAYSILIFILMVMGFGTAKPDGQWNIICQQRLVFEITFPGDGSDVPGDDRGCF